MALLGIGRTPLGLITSPLGTPPAGSVSATPGAPRAGSPAATSPRAPSAPPGPGAPALPGRATPSAATANGSQDPGLPHLTAVTGELAHTAGEALGPAPTLPSSAPRLVPVAQRVRIGGHRRRTVPNRPAPQPPTVLRPAAPTNDAPPPPDDPVAPVQDSPAEPPAPPMNSPVQQQPQQGPEHTVPTELSSTELDRLAQQLLHPMLRRIRGELLLDRERRGRRGDWR